MSYFTQNENNKWYFGQGAGLDFLTNPPSILSNSSMTVVEGSASAADASGNLLFYTDGVTVWNQSHAVMANGTMLGAIGTPAQSSLIVKQPGNASIYYIFTMAGNPGGGNFNYSIVDMSLAAGMGSVTVKNAPIFLNSSSSEKITGVTHCNGVDVWIVSHLVGSNNFVSYLLTAAGFSLSAVVSSIGPVHTGASIGYMKISPNARKLGLAMQSIASQFELYDFDNATGIVSNSLALGGVSNNAYGCEFSPDGSKFYGAKWGTFNGTEIYQWDLCAGSPTAIIASQYTVTNSPNSKGALQVAPNGKIYSARYGQQTLGVINNPNAAGAACNYVDLGQSISPAYCNYGLPNFIAKRFKPPVFTYTLSGVASCQSASFTAPYNAQTFTNVFCGISGYSLTNMVWNFGDPNSGINNTSALSNPTHTFSNIGTYTTQLIMYYSCGGGTDTLRQVVTISNPCLTINSNSITCASLGSATLLPTGIGGPYTYTWLPSNQTGSVASGLSPGTYNVLVHVLPNNMTMTLTTTFTSLIPLTGNLFNTPSITCNGVNTATATVTNLAGGSGNQNYLWTNGLASYTNPTPQNLSAGQWSVSVTDALTACQINSVFTITQPPALTLNIAASSPTSCVGTSISFTASNSGGTPGGGAGYTYTWSTGPQTDTYTSLQNTAGNYVYTVNSSDANNCLSTQTIAVLFVPNPTLSVSHVSICPLEMGTLTVSGASTYTWSNNTVAASLTDNPVSSTQYTVIGSALSCTSSATASIIVKPLPNPIITNNSPVCENAHLIFSVSSGTAALWSGPQSFVSSSTTNTITNTTPNQTGVYTVTVSAANSCTASTSASLSIKPLPTLTISPISPSICANTTTVSLNASGTATLFNWSPALGLSSGSSSVVNVAPAATQVYTVIGSLNSCTSAANATVTVVPPPSLALSLSSPSFCAQALNGSPNSITLTSSGATTFTLLTPNHFTNPNPSGPASPVSLTPPYLNAGPATATLLGSNGVCTLSLTANFTVVPNPTVALNSFTPVICAGQTFTYTTSGATSFTWSSATPGSPLYTTGNVAVANPSINSVFSVFGSSLSCNSALQTTSITVTPLPVFTIQPNPALTCLGTPINLAAIGNASTYSWSPSTSLNQSVGNSVNANPSATQQYTIIGTSNNCSTTAMATVSVLPLPNLQLSPTQSAVCIGNPLHLNVFGASQFTWSPNTGLNTVNSPNVIASPNVNTTYLVVGSNGLCTNTLSIPITVIAYPSLTVTSPYQEICIGSSVPIYASGAQNYAWLPATGLTNNNGISALASPNVNTTYTIIGINSSGSVQCTQQIAYQILVIPLANAQISNSTAICLGEATPLTASGGNVYEWLPQEGLNNTHQPNVIATPTISTTYTVDVSQNGFCNAKKSVFVQVNPNPIINAGRDSSFNLNEPMFIMASGTGSITWISGEGIACSTCAYTQIYPRIDNCYIALVTNEFNCTAKDEVCIKVTAEYAIYIPNSFTPNKDGLNDVFFVYGDNLIDLQLQIFDRWGQLIFYSENPSSGWDGSYQGKDCPMGTYTYKVAYKSPDRKQFFKAGLVSLMR